MTFFLAPAGESDTSQILRCKFQPHDLKLQIPDCIESRALQNQRSMYTREHLRFESFGTGGGVRFKDSGGVKWNPETGDTAGIIRLTCL